jgi:hypothetical protein
MTNLTIESILDIGYLTSEKGLSPVNERMTNFSTTFGILTLLPEIASVPIFSIAILIMYHGVEIEHPIYSVLFFNLIFPFFVNLIIISSAFASNMKIFLNVSAFGNMICLLHHHTCWMVLSGLRYAYIVNPDWLHSTWPDVKCLRCFSLTIVYFSFTLVVTLVLSILLVFAVPYGWPKIHFYAIPHNSKVTIVLLILIAYHIPTLCSFVLYILLVFATTNKLSKVGVLPKGENKQVSINLDNSNLENVETNSTVDICGINVGRDIPLFNEPPSQSSIINFPHEERSDIESNILVEQNARAFQELISALRSLKTNLLVFFVGMITGFIIYLLPVSYQEELNLSLSSVQKLIFPVLTTMANFGTIRSVCKEFLAKLCDRDEVVSLIWH